MIKNDLVIFLDFDGVFHHVFPVKSGIERENELFYYTENIESFFSELTSEYNLKIVFATSWKEKFSFETLKGFFEDYPCIYNACLDCTPNIKSLSDEGYKWCEAECWIAQNDYTGQYIILDDYSEVWKKNGQENPDLIICEDKFDIDEMQKIRNRLSFFNK